MVTDHSEVNDKLQAAASKQGVNVPSEMNSEDQATFDKLSKLSGPEFDRAYMANMVRDHKKDINEFEREAKTGKVSAIRQFAQETLPTLREHLQMTEKAEKSISSTSSSGM